MAIEIRKTKNIITKSKLPDADYVINPYLGCTHACTYCYAEFMKRFINIDKEWGTFVVLRSFDEKKMKTNFKKDENIIISSVTDPYQPVEKKENQMRKILLQLANTNGNIEIITKSSLVLRDIDLIKKIPNIKIGISMNSLDDKFRKLMEPGASSIEERIKTLKELKKNNIETYCFISPIFPYISDYIQIIKELENVVDYFLFENLNLRGVYKKRVLNLIKSNYNEYYDKYLNIYTQKGDVEYWEKVREEIETFTFKRVIKSTIYFNHAMEKK
jgi:DNA repair photolyase